jgi:enterochelin esterase-like enzyme
MYTRLLSALLIGALLGSISTVLLSDMRRRLPGPSFEIVVPGQLQQTPVDGRLLLVISSVDEPEPRLQPLTAPDGPTIFGVDVEQLKPDTAAIIHATSRGFPQETLRDLPAGDYTVQAVLNVYTTFARADGHTVKAHMDQWEGQQWNRSPGNLVTEPQRIHFDPGRSSLVRLTFARVLPPIDPPRDSKYVKHLKFKSESLSRWWGREINLGAVVLLPEGYDEHPTAKYPVAYEHDHFGPSIGGFRETPPDTELKGNALAQAESAYRFYQDWTSGRLPRMLIVRIQHPTPYYDDSYAVNSANNGPYGDTLTKELIPLVEKQFHAIGEPWARLTFGGSTGGWESLAWQIFYPDMFNGVWSFCPDPVDFRYFQLVNIYEDQNAFHINGRRIRSNRPSRRTVDDQVLLTIEDESRLEQVLGTRGRSGGQWDAWMATFGPVGTDGYPKLLWDKWTGVIDRSVVDYWREHYDLRDILERNWKAIGPKLVGKLHFYVGDQDSYFLEEAAFKMREFLEGTKDPSYQGSFDVGQRQPHCYAGMPAFAGQTPRHRVLPQMQDRILATAPAGADIKSWRY